MSFNEGLKTIESEAFAACYKLTEITIPEMVEVIGNRAFAQNFNLEKITIYTDKGVMAPRTFSLCPKLYTIKVVPYQLSGLAASDLAGYHLIIIGNGAIEESYIDYWGVNLLDINSLTISEGITSIAPNTFKNSNSIQEVVIPESITTLGANSFGSCAKLRKVYLPHHLSPQFADAFNGTKNITLTLTGSGVFSSGIYGSNVSHLIIGGNISEVGRNAVTSLLITRLTFGDSVEVIHREAVSLAYYLTDINIGRGVRQIEEGAFVYLPALLRISLDQNNHTMQLVDGVLYNEDCTTLLLYPAARGESSYTVLESVKTIGLWAFEEVKYLQTIILSPGLEVISERAFANAKKLTTIHLPASVHTIGNSAFSSCESLFSINLEHVAFIGDEAFRYCIKLQKVTFGPQLSEISSGAFINCISLTSVEIPANIKNISSFAFADCASLQSVTLVEGLLTIDNSAFSDNVRLSAIYLPGTLLSLGKDAFSNCLALSLISVSTGQINGYNEAFTGSNAPKTLIIYGTGVIDTTFKKDLSITKLIIEDSVTGFSQYAFAEAKNITEVVAPHHIFSAFGWGAMFPNNRKVNLTLTGEGEISYYAFSNAWLGDVVISEGITQIGERAFSGSTLTSVKLPQSLKRIGAGAFINAVNLETIKLNFGLERIDSYAFAYCTKLENIIIPATVKTIGEEIFNACPDIIVFSESSGPLPGWHKRLSNVQITVYWGGNWTFDENNKPIPKNIH